MKDMPNKTTTQKPNVNDKYAGPKKESVVFVMTDKNGQKTVIKR
jgi:hypothetical protein